MYPYNPLLIEFCLVEEGWKDQLIKDPGMIAREVDPVKRKALKLLRRRLINGRKVMPGKIKRDVVGMIPQGKFGHGWQKDSIRIMKPTEFVSKLERIGRSDKTNALDIINASKGKATKLDSLVTKRKPGAIQRLIDDKIADAYWG